jgi:integrase
MAERINFTKEKIKAIKAPCTGRKYVYDTEVPNLCVCVTEKGTKTYYRYGRVHGQPQRYKIGKVEDLTIKQARDECRRLNGEIATRQNPMDARRKLRAEMTIGQLFNWVLEHHSKPTKRTWKRDKFEYDSKVSHWANRRISTLTTPEIREHHNKLKESKGSYAANKMREVLRLMYSIAVQNKWVDENPVDAVPRAETQERERFLSADELVRWFKAVANLKREATRDFFLMALFTGARRDNVASMRWDEIDMDRAVWTIPASKFKTKKPVQIVLVPQAMEILERRHQDGDSVWVFPGQGRRGHFVEPKSAWRKVCIEAGLVDAEENNTVRLHDLRRTLGSWQAAGGASLHIIGKSLGHRSTSATQIYARLDLDPVRASVSAAVNAIEAAGKKSEKNTQKNTGGTKENADP